MFRPSVQRGLFRYLRVWPAAPSPAAAVIWRMDLGDLVVTTGQLPDVAPEIIDNLNDYAQRAKGAYAAATEKAINSDTAIWSAWCAINKHTSLPAKPLVLASYIDELANIDPDTGKKRGKPKRKPKTIERYISSIAHLHRAAGLPSPASAEVVRLALRRMRNQHRGRPRQTDPLGEANIDTIITSIQQGRGGEPLAVVDHRDIAMLLVMRDTLCRASEICALEWSGYHRDRDGSGTILVPYSKTDQSGEGDVRWISPAAVDALRRWRDAHDRRLKELEDGEQQRYDDAMEIYQRQMIAWAQLQEYHEAIKRREQGNPAAKAQPLPKRPHGRPLAKEPMPPRPIEWVPSTHIFRPVDERGEDGWPQQMDTHAVIYAVQRRCAAAGLGEGRWTAHSTRVGAVQDLIAAGADLPSVMQAGGWKSAAMPARYGERLLAKRGAVAKMRSAK